MTDLVEQDSRQNNPSNGARCPTIKPPLFLCKIIWSLFGSGAGLYIMFRNPFLISVGISAREAGLINGIASLVSAVLTPLWGILADKTGARRCITVFLCLCIPIVLFATPWIGSVLSTTHCKSEEITNSTTFLKRTSETLNYNNNFTFKVCDEDNDKKNSLFYAMLMTYILASSFFAPIDGFFKSLTMNVLEQIRTSQGCGDLMWYRFFGSGIAGLCAGYFADRLDHPSLTSYGAAYFLLLPFMLPLVPITFFLFRYTKWDTGTETADFDNLHPVISNPMHMVKGDDEVNSDEHEENTEEVFSRTSAEKEKGGDWNRNEEGSCSNTGNAPADIENGSETESQYHTEVDGGKLGTTAVNQEQMPVMQAVRHILTKGDNFVLLLTLLIVGILMSCTYSFLLLIIKDEMNGSKTSMGIAILVDNLAAAAMQFFAERVIKILGGPIICIELGLLSWIIRLVVTSYIQESWLVLLPQLLNSFGRGLFTVAMIKHIHQVTPIQVHSTMFTLYAMLQFSAGIFLANIAGGSVYQTYKGPLLFRGAAVGGGLWLAFLLTYFHCMPALKRCWASRKTTE